MKNIINIFKEDLEKIVLELVIDVEPTVEINKTGIQSDFSTTLALMGAKKIGKNPKELAELIKEKLLAVNNYDEVEVAGPGFINVKMKKKLLSSVIQKISAEKSTYGVQPRRNQIINIEYVSANPTGFLHVGHARNAVNGSVLEEIFKADGYEVQTEYYVNDAGNQINILAVTVFVHYLNLLGINAVKPENSYGGDMYDEVAGYLIDEFGDKFKTVTFSDAMINNQEVHQIFRKKSVDHFSYLIKQQLKDFGVVIEHWSSEQAMYDEKEIDKMLELYQGLGATYKKDNALWLRTTDFGDDKDRVLVKSDGTYTYIVPDLATHHIRIQRTKADKLINVWGGDHHGYIQRMRAGLALLGHDPKILEIEMVQMVRLIKDGAEYKMSKRKGTAVWLVDIQEMVGKDGLRYMLASKASSSHMDLDLDLIQQKNASNPIYYAQYATARCNSILKQAREKEITVNIENSELLSTPKEAELIVTLDNFGEVIKSASKNRAPQIICEYIQSIAKQFHSYYSDTKIIDENNILLSSVRLGLVAAVLQVLTNAFNLIGIEVLEKM
ncbi:arginine--tRNA ligase [Mesoplasma syrphidae]|uniref:Arginine--tRNA ligase n=1 Tax=Mesoplasma syrphidae TaxID=225999 RepID=A0A2K9BRQ2_9MOLU|nr:arginine--tRNA ligase [Mesoplasma syrphidae]AUF83682.1 arginine--tRNA ligase [Mesoplasma syrphidae]